MCIGLLFDGDASWGYNLMIRSNKTKTKKALNKNKSLIKKERIKTLF